VLQARWQPECLPVLLALPLPLVLPCQQVESSRGPTHSELQLLWPLVVAAAGEVVALLCPVSILCAAARPLLLILPMLRAAL
jgi:hypothetical protein